jgi:hypothetical protein
MSRTSSVPSASPTLARRASRTLEVAFTTVVAWAFGVATAGVLLYVASGLYRGNLKVATPLTPADPAIVGSVSASKPWALTFEGHNGAALAAGMAAMVLVALGLSMMFASNPRRLGLLMLTAWSGVWAADGVLIVGNTGTARGSALRCP